MPDRHVVPAESGWQVEKEDAKRPSAKAPTQAEAVKRAVEIVANDGGGQVVVHGSDGAVRETRTVEAGAEDTASTTAVTATSSAKKGAQATAGKAADTVSSSADAVADDTSATASKAATKAREIADDVTAAGRRVDAEASRTARKGGEALVDGADRAAEVGDDLGDRLQTASHRTGEYIHSFTERVAHPIDAAARALNPVRIAGRTAGVVIAGALHIGSVVTRRGTRTAERSARVVAGRR